MLLTNIGHYLLTFTPIDQRWYLNMTASSTAFFSAVNSSTKVYVCTDVCLFDEQVFGVGPTTEIRPVIFLPDNLSCTWSANKNMSRSNSSNKVLGSLPLIYSGKYEY